MGHSRDPHPAFLELRVVPGQARATDETLCELLESEGPLITPLGNDRYVMAQAALKRLTARRPENDIRGWLKSESPQILKLEFRTGEYVQKAYCCRPKFGPRDNLAVFERPLCTETPWRDTIGLAPATGLLDAMRRQRGGSLRFPRLAHLDTGVASHTALNFPLAGECGVNFVEPGQLPKDNLDKPGSPGRGTRLLAIICGCDENAGFFGIAPGLRPVPYRVGPAAILDLTSSALAEALQHAVFDAGCEVICITAGHPCAPTSPALTEQIDAAYEAGAIVVAPAGDIFEQVVYPGRYQRVITAAGAGGADQPWLGSARGLAVDICAPAIGIRRPELGRANDPGSGYALGAGTGYAAAQVASAAALWLAFHNEHLQFLARTWRLVEAFRQCLTASAQRPDGWRDRLWGAGVLNLCSLLLEPLPDTASLVMQPPAAIQKW